MARTFRAGFAYGMSAADVADELREAFATDDLELFETLVCACGRDELALQVSSDSFGVAWRCVRCSRCGARGARGRLVSCECICGSEVLQVVLGESAFRASRRVAVVGGRCVRCGIVASFGRYLAFRDADVAPPAVARGSLRPS